MRLATLALALVLSACADDAAPPVPAEAATPDANNPAASMDSIPPAALRTDSISADYDEPVTLVSMKAGDVACYLTVHGAQETRTELADFRVCERTDLVGTRVLLTATPSQVQAQSCGGDPECRDTEAVNLVTGIDPASEELPPAPPPK